MNVKEWNKEFFNDRMRCSRNPVTTAKVTTELWRTIAGVEGLQVSDEGRVRRISIKQILDGETGELVSPPPAEAVQWRKETFPLSLEVR